MFNQDFKLRPVKRNCYKISPFVGKVYRPVTAALELKMRKISHG